MSGRRAFRIIDHTINILMVAIFLPLLMLGGYALWDNHQDMPDAHHYESYKPTSRMSFAALQKMNPDVFGWLTINDTNIDSPLVQGQDNEKYVNTNVEGKFSLGGSLFLDYRNHQDFRDVNNIIYGHNIEDQAMFGELKNYGEKDFFDHHLKGKIYYQNKWHTLEIFAYIHTNAHDKTFYTTSISRQILLNAIQKKSAYKKDLSLDQAHILTLSTCTNADTDGRYLLMAKIGGEIS